MVVQVLARPLFVKVKNQIPFYRKQVMNRSTRVTCLTCYIKDTVEKGYDEV